MVYENHPPVTSLTKEEKFLAGGIFLHLVGLQIVLLLRDEGAQLDLTDFIARAGLSCFEPGLGRKKAAEILASANKEFQSIITAGRGSADVRAYARQIEDAVYLYVLPGGEERYLHILHKLYSTLSNAQK